MKDSFLHRYFSKILPTLLEHLFEEAGNKADDETIDEKIKGHLVTESKSTCTIQEKILSYIEQKMNSSKPRPKKYIKPTIYKSAS